MPEEFVTVQADFWDSAAFQLAQKQSRKPIAVKTFVMKKTLFVQTHDERFNIRKGKKFEKEISRIWNKVRPPKGGDSGGLFLITVGEIEPRKRKKPVKQFSKRRESQIIRGTIIPFFRNNKIAALRGKGGRFVTFK